MGSLEKKIEEFRKEALEIESQKSSLKELRRLKDLEDKEVDIKLQDLKELAEEWEKNKIEFAMRDLPAEQIQKINEEKASLERARRRVAEEKATVDESLE